MRSNLQFQAAAAEARPALDLPLCFCQSSLENSHGKLFCDKQKPAGKRGSKAPGFLPSCFPKKRLGISAAWADKDVSRSGCSSCGVYRPSCAAVAAAAPPVRGLPVRFPLAHRLGQTVCGRKRHPAPHSSLGTGASLPCLCQKQSRS